MRAFEFRETVRDLGFGTEAVKYRTVALQYFTDCTRVGMTTVRERVRNVQKEKRFSETRIFIFPNDVCIFQVQYYGDIDTGVQLSVGLLLLYRIQSSICVLVWSVRRCR